MFKSFYRLRSLASLSAAILIGLTFGASVFAFADAGPPEVSNGKAAVAAKYPDVSVGAQYDTTHVYVAPDEASVRTHAQKGGFPANSIARVRAVIDPTTAEAAA